MPELPKMSDPEVAPPPPPPPPPTVLAPELPKSALPEAPRFSAPPAAPFQAPATPKISIPEVRPAAARICLEVVAGRKLFGNCEEAVTAWSLLLLAG